jgi:hypothetical protein
MTAGTRAWARCTHSLSPKVLKRAQHGLLLPVELLGHVLEDCLGRLATCGASSGADAIE